MKLSPLVHLLVGLAVVLRHPPARGERGLSQSAENAILLGGAVGIATTIILVIRAYVVSHLPR